MLYDQPFHQLTDLCSLRVATGAVIQDLLAKARPQQADLIVFDPSIEPVLRSVNSDVSTFVTFVNVRSDPVHIYWINFQATRQSYGVLEGNGAEMPMNTYVTHPWVIIDEKTQVPICVFNPASWRARALIR